ncbi:hypothetical protein WUBG_03325 [Wuchereria bancrofti]|uniref:Uncharacterized protein n=1 Tax=Wuchereria bancrofti TaxID=6293 RepID=J9FEI1_WUCBA|nr:hypothetical protein WUBG_03325 [Wuchereria bancrofti]
MLLASNYERTVKKWPIGSMTQRSVMARRNEGNRMSESSKGTASADGQPTG